MDYVDQIRNRGFLGIVDNRTARLLKKIIDKEGEEKLGQYLIQALRKGHKAFSVALEVEATEF